MFSRPTGLRALGMTTVGDVEVTVVILMFLLSVISSLPVCMTLTTLLSLL